MVNTKQFRYDINGLRAYAVILVVLFHFQILGFSAGFIGVDIFFVISGYLMTKIIIDQIMNEKFSIWKFYLARGIRILPALLLLSVMIALVGWFLLIPEEYKSYVKHAASSITFLSNLMYWRESNDYFSAAAHDKILLHTWSLSVEWQFYIILPIILLIIAKIKRNRNILNSAILLGFIISLILSYKVSQFSQTTAFYMIPTRAWEMLAGGLVYIYFKNATFTKLSKNIIEFTGFSVIFISLFIFKPDTLWPSFNAALPVLGSMLILISNNNSLFTKSKIFQVTGDSSYSIYLWHWPIVFFISYFGVKNNQFIVISGIFLSIFLGWISYKFIETPTRKYLTRISIFKSYMILIIVTGILASTFTLIFFKNGIPERESQDYSKKIKEVVMPLPTNGWCFYSVDTISSLSVGKDGLNCKVGASDDVKHTALLFGDSFAGHNIPFWDEVGKKLNTKVHPVTTNWCYPGLDDQFTGPKSSRAFEQCKFNRKYLFENMDKYDYLILAGMWKDVSQMNQLENFDNLLAEAKKLNISVIVMAAPYSFDRNVGNAYKKSVWMNQKFVLSNYINDEYDFNRKNANQIIRKISDKYTNTLFIDDSDLYSEDHLTKEGYPYSFDGNHISVAGSKGSANFFEKSEKFLELKSIINSN